MTPIQTIYDRAAAFIAAGDKWTIERFAAEVHCIANGLAARGIGRGDPIALHLPNCPELAVAVYACFRSYRCPAEQQVEGSRAQGHAAAFAAELESIGSVNARLLIPRLQS